MRATGCVYRGYIEYMAAGAAGGFGRTDSALTCTLIHMNALYTPWRAPAALDPDRRLVVGWAQA